MSENHRGMSTAGLVRMVLLTLVGLTATRGDAAAQTTDLKVLERLFADRGLERDGNWFLTAEETLLRSRLAQLRTLEKALQDATNEADRALVEVDGQRAQLEQAELEHQRLAAQLADRSLPVRQYNQVVRELNLRTETINRLRPIFAGKSGLWDHAPLRSALSRLSAAQTELWAALVFIRHGCTAIEIPYRALAEDTQVTNALAEWGGKYKLGPARSYERELKKLPRLEKIVFTPDLPSYREEGLQRVGAILQERLPVVVAIASSDEHTIVPEQLLRSAGIPIPDEARQVTVEAGNSRRLEGRVVTLPALRIGTVLLDPFEVIALGESGYDLGFRLGRRALAKWKVELDEPRQRLKLVPHDPASEPPAVE